MFIADAQIHIWAPNSPERPWRPGQNVHREPPLEADEVLATMDAAGVSRAVLVPPSLDDDRNDLCLAAARKHPDRFACVGRLDPDAPDARETLPNWRKQPGMLGLRYSLNRPHWVPILEERTIDWLWAGAEKAGIPVMTVILHSVAHLIDDLAARFPDLKIAIGHLGLAHNKYDEEAFKDIGNVIALAKRPNVSVTLSALPCHTREAYPYPSLQARLRPIFDAFGPERIFWGSDLSRLPIPHGKWVEMFTREVPWLSAEDREKIMGRSLCKWLDWPVAEGKG
jgi:L-fuconolactonase